MHLKVYGLRSIQLNSIRAFSVGRGGQGKVGKAALPESGGAQAKQEYVFVLLLPIFAYILNSYGCICFYIFIGFLVPNLGFGFCADLIFTLELLWMHS